MHPRFLVNMPKTWRTAFVIADDFVMKLAGEKVLNGLQSHDFAAMRNVLTANAAMRKSTA
jgi:hypothetical protein